MALLRCWLFGCLIDFTFFLGKTIRNFGETIYRMGPVRPLCFPPGGGAMFCIGNLLLLVTPNSSGT